MVAKVLILVRSRVKLHMDTVLIIIGALLLVGGLLGSVLPVLPGPPLSFLGLLTLRFLETPAIGDNGLIIWGLIAAFITILDYYLPVWTAGRMGGSKLAVWGATLGLILGLFLGPAGVILGPLLGAITGELLAGKPFDQAFRTGVWAFIGFAGGILVKIVYALAAGFKFVYLLV